MVYQTFECYIRVICFTTVVLYYCTLQIELSALADLMGPYGIRHLGEQLTDLVSSQVKELKVIMAISIMCILLVRRNMKSLYILLLIIVFIIVCCCTLIENCDIQ